MFIFSTSLYYDKHYLNEKGYSIPPQNYKVYRILLYFCTEQHNSEGHSQDSPHHTQGWDDEIMSFYDSILLAPDGTKPGIFVNTTIMKKYHIYIITASCSNIKEYHLITKGKCYNTILVNDHKSKVLLSDFNDHLSIALMTRFLIRAICGPNK